MAIGFFILSLLFLIVVSVRRAINILSLYWIFAGFQCLYNITPWIVSVQSFQSFTLLTDSSVIGTQLWLAASANICFGTVFLAFYKEVPFVARVYGDLPHKRRNFVLAVIPVFVLICVLCAKYGWNALAVGMATGAVNPNPGGMYGLAVDAKFLYIGIYLYYLYRFGLDKGAWTLFGGNVVILAIDGGRTTFLPVALVTLILYREQTSKSAKRFKLYLLTILGVGISIAARAVVLNGDSGIVKMMIPITVEGTMGAYPSLQSIYAIQHHANDSFTYGGSYLIDPIVWTFFPHGELRERLQFFGPWTRNVGSGIPEDFAPAGGFYYVSEAVAAFSYAGPAIVTAAFALFLVWIERLKRRYPLVYTTAASTLGVMFVKYVFAGAFKMFVIELAIAYTFVGIHRLRVFLGRTSPVRLFQSRLADSN